MKINPPKVIIEGNEPFKHALFRRKELADSLTQLLRNVQEGLVVFVNAPWGEGKTTFAEMWRADLRRQKLDVIYFDAYAADYFDDPFVSFSGEILALVDSFGKAEGLNIERREFKKTAIEIGKRLAGLAVKVGLRAATVGAFDSTHLKELEEIRSEVASGVSEIGADIIEKKIENYAAEKDALKSFKESLARIAKLVRAKQGFPLTIVVDELDRCRPDFALGLLERIKHLFDVEDVAFVLLVNQDQIESYVRTVYGERVDASAYLLKFANLFVDLPNQQPSFHHENSRRSYSQSLIVHYGLAAKIKDGEFWRRSLDALLDHFGLTLREIEKVFAIMTLYYGSLPNNQFTNSFLVPMLSILKVKRPSLYQNLRIGGISVADFLAETGLNKIKENQQISQGWIDDMLNFCLMSDAEFAKAIKAEEIENNRGGLKHMGGAWLFHYNMDRKTVIPFLCGRLDLFSLTPE